MQHVGTQAHVHQPDGLQSPRQAPGKERQESRSFCLLPRCQDAGSYPRLESSRKRHESWCLFPNLELFVLARHVEQGSPQRWLENAENLKLNSTVVGNFHPVFYSTK